MINRTEKNVPDLISEAGSVQKSFELTFDDWSKTPSFPEISQKLKQLKKLIGELVELRERMAYEAFLSSDNAIRAYSHFHGTEVWVVSNENVREKLIAEGLKDVYLASEILELKNNQKP